MEELTYRLDQYEGPLDLLLTLIAGAASVLFIVRYDPLKILANRD